jgi:hypothetical protein
VERERALVQQLGSPLTLDAMRQLAGGVTATELRSARVTPAAFAALVEGLSDPRSRIRWWCVQVLDHVPDPAATIAIARMLDDPVPRVRRNAAHALGCVACKPEWSGGLPPDVVARLQDLAENDANAKVRSEASLALACRGR